MLYCRPSSVQKWWIMDSSNRLYSRWDFTVFQWRNY